MESIFYGVSQRCDIGNPLDIASHVRNVFNLAGTQVVDKEDQLADLQADSEFVEAAPDEVTHD